MARGAHNRKCHPARRQQTRAASSSRMRARLSAAATGHLEGKRPPTPMLCLSPSLGRLFSRNTYRLRTSSGREMAGTASAGTRAGAVRAGISETAADAAAVQAAPAFRAETNGEGRRAEAARTTLARARGKEGRTMRERPYHVRADRAELAVLLSCACVRRARTPSAEQWVRPSSANVRRQGGAVPETVIHSFFPACGQ